MATVHVSNIAPQTRDDELREFFSYCGEIDNLSYEPNEKQPGKAQLTFKRDAAAQTARLLDNTELNGLAVKVEVASSLDELAAGQQTTGAADELKQEDKPRAAIFAEYLSRGYVIGDHALQRGIDLDKKHGISKRFTDYLAYVDSKLHPVNTARSVDETYKVSDKAGQAFNTANIYFEKVVGAENKRKIRDFYAQAHKQVVDIHTEARRLADEKHAAQGGPLGQQRQQGGQQATSSASHASTAPVAGGEAKEAKTSCDCSVGAQGCTCTPGACTCTNCGH